MKNRAFTLIELLVVVLIIGILAAIAVPQYQKAVINSRYNSLKLLTKSISDAQDVYMLSNGEFAESFNELDITMPSGILNTNKMDELTLDQYNYDWGYCKIYRNVNGKMQTQCLNAKINMGYNITEAKNKECFVYGSTSISDYPIQNAICQSETGLSKRSGSGHHGDVPYSRWRYQN